MNKLKLRTLQLPKTKTWVFVPLFIVLHIFIVRNVTLMVRDVLYMDHSADNLFPRPAYPLYRIPETELTRQYGAENRLEADFAGLYFPALRTDILDQNYENGNMDPWNRPSHFAPLIDYLCAISICKLNFGPASIALLSFQYLLFLTVYISSFWFLDIKKHIWTGLLLANVYIFLTPTGLSWLERGQYYLFLGSGYLLLLIGFIKGNKWLILLSAFLVFIRWSSLPITVICFAVYGFNSRSLSEFWKRILVGIGFVLIMLGLLLPYYWFSLAFLQDLINTESGTPAGISLATILPTVITKFLPFVLIILAAIMAKINNRQFEENIPFLAGAAIFLLIYPTQPFEYSLASLLGFIPLFLYWTKQPGTFIIGYKREILKYIFLVFLLTASFSHYVMGKIIYIYILAALILLILPIYYYLRSGSNRKLSQQGTNS